LLWLMVLFNLLFTLTLARRVRTAFPRHDYIKVGQRAPDFIAQTLKGKSVTLATFSGQAVAFVFMSPNCEPCRDKLLDLLVLLPRAKQLGVEVAIVSDVNEEETLSLIQGVEGSLTVLFAPRNRTTFIQDYKVYAIPSYYLIDPQGKVWAAGDGVSELGGKIEALSRVTEGGDG
jgi:peroxiredoxin